MGGTLIELQAARIAAVLEAHAIPNRVDEARITRRFVRFTVRIALGKSIAKIERLAEEIALALDADQVRVQRKGGAIYVDVPDTEAPARLDLAAALGDLKSVPPYTAVLGEEVTGVPLLLRLDSPDTAHLLIAGTTGSGKTELERTLLLSLALLNRPAHLQFVLLDPKRKLAPLEALPHAWLGLPCITDMAEASLVLNALVLEMERRDRLNVRLPHLIVAIDELADLLQIGGSAVSDALQRLTQRGREANIHVIAATQRPSADSVSGLIKSNFVVRLVGSVVSTDDAKVAAGMGDSGANHLLGQGDFLAVVKGDPIRFQAAYITGPEQTALIAYIMGHSANGAAHRRSRGITAEQVRAACRHCERSEAISRRSRPVLEALAYLVGQVGGVGGESAPAESSAATGFPSGPAHPPTHPPAPLALSARAFVMASRTKPSRPTLRDRCTPALLYQTFLAQGRNIKNTAIAAFGYSDTPTMALVREAIALNEPAGGKEVLQ